MKNLIKAIQNIFKKEEPIIPISTKAFIIKKNEIVKRVTGETLVPEDQIIDEPKVLLNNFPGIFKLHAEICPYCVSRAAELGHVYCKTCPMYLADNGCDDINSTWNKANKIWRNLATESDKFQIERLVNRYNRELKES